VLRFKYAMTCACQGVTTNIYNCIFLNQVYIYANCGLFTTSHPRAFYLPFLIFYFVSFTFFMFYFIFYFLFFLFYKQRVSCIYLASFIASQGMWWCNTQYSHVIRSRRVMNTTVLFHFFTANTNLLVYRVTMNCCDVD